MKKQGLVVLICAAVGLLALVISVTGAAWVLKFSQVEPLTATPSLPGPGVVCTGYVDVESGVAELAPLGQGRVIEVKVRENDAVKAGDILVRLDDTQSRLQVEEAQADLDAACQKLSQADKLPEQQQIRVAQEHSAIEAVHQRLSAARHVLTRRQDLEKIQQVSREEVAAAEANVQELDALEKEEEGKLRELELNDPFLGRKGFQAEVDARQARLKQASRAVEECHVRAPSEGTVLRILVAPGDVLGGQPRQSAVLFCPNGPRIIRAEVAQEFARGVYVNQAVSARDDTTDDAAAWTGKVVRISDWYTRRRSILREPLEVNDVRTLECLIALDPHQPPLRVGQRMRVTMPWGER